MEDANYVRVLEQYLKSINLNATYKLLPDDKNAEGRLFRFQLTVTDKSVTGVGKTKKKAKEDAAEIMYNLLIDEEKRIAAHNYPEKKTKDPIEALTDLCSKFKLGTPKFEYDSDIDSSSHGTMYNVSCTVLGLTEEVRSFRKDRAKKQAANKMFLKLKEQEKIHDNYFRLIEEETKKNVSFISPDGTVNEEEKEKFITNLWKVQFADYLKKSRTARDMKMKEQSHLDEIEDPEGLFSRIMKEMGVAYEIGFHVEDHEWVCSIEILQLYFKTSMKNKDKTLAGKSAIKRVLKYMHDL
ncbi:interferon-inducible double-stranded RNA-dependent protein kinase activator A homolog [Halyomorpha halys]|uniref:interferon-inducible double-stranded RNA-dependent protein kinase activator A homolog n=1 Tax=Halyomorpha halys TaxID=286706 RepID=UPI0006D52405|nr:uncharacterized protein LOC106690469 [Halyomorpha halys]